MGFHESPTSKGMLNGQKFNRCTEEPKDCSRRYKGRHCVTKRQRRESTSETFSLWVEVSQGSQRREHGRRKKRRFADRSSVTMKETNVRCAVRVLRFWFSK